MLLSSLFEIRTERLNLLVSLSCILLESANHAHEIPLLAFRLLDPLFQHLNLNGGGRLSG